MKAKEKLRYYWPDWMQVHTLAEEERLIEEGRRLREGIRQPAEVKPRQMPLGISSEEGHDADEHRRRDDGHDD